MNHIILHPLEVNIECSEENYDKYFGFNYKFLPSEFIYYKSFHSTIELNKRMKKVNLHYQHILPTLNHLLHLLMKYLQF